MKEKNKTLTIIEEKYKANWFCIIALGIPIFVLSIISLYYSHVNIFASKSSTVHEGVLFLDSIILFSLFIYIILNNIERREVERKIKIKEEK